MGFLRQTIGALDELSAGGTPDAEGPAWVAAGASIAVCAAVSWALITLAAPSLLGDIWGAVLDYLP